MEDEQTIKMTGIVKEDEFLTFEIVGKKPKTLIYAVISKSSNCVLGMVRWHPAWRHYCYFPNRDEDFV